MKIVRLHQKGSMNAHYGIQTSSYSRALHHAAKETPGMTWNGQLWIGWPDAVRECARRITKEGIELDGKRPSRSALQRRVDISADQYAGLRGYQKEGVCFLASLGKTGALLADDLGLGKTAQACRAVGVFQRDAIIVCPSFVRTVWVREFAKWLPDVSIIELKSTASTPLYCPVCLIIPGEGMPKHPPHFGRCCRYCGCAGMKQNVYLVHYDIIWAWTKELLATKAGVVVFDEVHMLQSESSRRSIACRELARGMRYRIGLSGTPMTNRPADLWNPIDILCPGRFGKPWAFYVAHAGAHQETIETREGPKTVWKKDGASRLKELNRRLQQFMLRRTKTDVRMELPPRVRQMVEIEVKKNFRSLPSRTIKGNKKWLRKAFAIAADGKIPQAAELIASHVVNGSRVIVFSHRRVVAELITAMLLKQKIDARTITGGLTRGARVRLVDEQHAVLSCTMDSVHVGIDMSYADVAVFVELDYEPHKIIQCEGRVYRFGQKRNTLFQYVIAQGTADEIVRDCLLHKLEHFEKAIGKMDDKLDDDLGGTKLDTPAQLRSLAEKIMKQTLHTHGLEKKRTRKAA